MSNKPYTYDVSLIELNISHYDHHLIRRLSAMEGQFLDQSAHEALSDEEDQIIYEVYQHRRPEVPGELLHGISIIHPGVVGEEYFMTKGHFHAELDTAELYYCLQGEGMMVMETPEGEWAIERLIPNRALYVPPRWAHRSVNIRLTEDLITLFVYPGHAGHDYRTIEQHGFRKLVLHREGKPVIVDNPHQLQLDG